MFISNQQLTKAQLIDTEGLRAACVVKDGNTIPIYPHILAQKRADTSNYLYYKNQRLLGFLSLYYFYHDACELALMVAPDVRHQGIAHALLKAAWPLIALKQFARVYISVSQSANHAWLAQKGFVYHKSEYEMQWQGTRSLDKPACDLVIRPALRDDQDDLVAIDNACFNSNPVETRQRLQTILHDPEYTVLIAFKEGVPVAKAHIHLSKSHARLLDIAVAPQYQRRGYGGTLIAFCVSRMRAADSVVLDVEATNIRALDLYRKLGFEIRNATDYWTISMKQLRHLVGAC